MVSCVTGTRIDANTCYCNGTLKWYRGTHCETRECGEHGQVNVDDAGECTCHLHFGGSNCETIDCTPYNTNHTPTMTLSRWDNVPARTYQTDCVCNDPYWGETCDQSGYGFEYGPLIFLVVVVIAIACCCYWCCRRKRNRQQQQASLVQAVYRTDGVTQQGQPTGVTYAPIPGTVGYAPGQPPPVGYAPMSPSAMYGPPAQPGPMPPGGAYGPVPRQPYYPPQTQSGPMPPGGAYGPVPSQPYYQPQAQSGPMPPGGAYGPVSSQPYYQPQGQPPAASVNYNYYAPPTTTPSQHNKQDVESMFMSGDPSGAGPSAPTASAPPEPPPSYDQSMSTAKP